MSLSFIMNFISKYNLAITILTNIAFFILNALILCFNTRQKFKLDKCMESYKHELQVNFLKSELKTTQLFTIYPQLFSKFKEAEASLAVIKILRDKQRGVSATREYKIATTDVTAANNYAAFNLIFLSTDVRNTAIKLKDLMVDYLFLESSKGQYDEIGKCMNVLEAQVANELENASYK